MGDEPGVKIVQLVLKLSFSTVGAALVVALVESQFPVIAIPTGRDGYRTRTMNNALKGDGLPHPDGSGFAMTNLHHCSFDTAVLPTQNDIRKSFCSTNH
jgi:hypothetical protein